MWKPRSLRHVRLPTWVFETLETWAGVLLALGTALLLYATLKAQLAYAAASATH
jgi:hypothetical protein